MIYSALTGEVADQYYEFAGHPGCDLGQSRTSGSSAMPALVGLATADRSSWTIFRRGQSARCIDAPELDQPFWWQGQKHMGGMMSLAALEALTAGVKVRCEVVERDRHGRIVAKVFTADGVDIGRRLVSAGWALAYRRYSTDYVDAEDEAREAKRGMWRGSFVKPWVWRASQGPQAAPKIVPMSGPRR